MSGLIESLKSGDWESESYPSYQDYAVLPLFALFFPSLRFLLDRFFFEKFGRRLIFGKDHAKLDMKTEERQKKLSKFKESAWKFVYYLSAEILSLSVTYNEPWFTNTKNFWVGPGDQTWPDLMMKLKLKAVYMYAGGFYTYSIFALVFWETRRSDFGVSMGHHVATVILIVLSYIYRFARVGSVVLAIHDASDVFLEIGKMSKYSGAEVLASVAFIFFVLSWILLRLVYFPFWILWSTSYEVLLTLDRDKHKYYGPIYYYTFNTLLYWLFILHVYWWELIYRMLVKQIKARGKLSDDVRSDNYEQHSSHFIVMLSILQKTRLTRFMSCENLSAITETAAVSKKQSQHLDSNDLVFLHHIIIVQQIATFGIIRHFPTDSNPNRASSC